MNRTATLLLACICSTAARAQWDYPATKITDSSSTYFGITYKDPYRWLEALHLPEANNWFRAQADFSNELLDRLTGRDELIAEWQQLDKLLPPLIHNCKYENGRVFYLKTIPGANVARVYYRQGIGGREILLFDPSDHIPGRTLSVTSILPSPDGKKIAIAYSENGAEISAIRVMDVDRKTFFPEIIYPSWFGPISWNADSRCFTYFSQKTADNTSPEFELNTKTKLHFLGADTASDIDFLSNESYPALPIQPNDMPFGGWNKNAKGYYFADLGNVRNEVYSLYAPDPGGDPSGKIAWKVLCSPKDQLVRSREIIGNYLYAITYRNARHYKLIRTPLSHPDWDHAETVVPENDSLILESISRCRDYLLLNYSDGVNSCLYQYELKTKLITKVSLPIRGSVEVFCLDNKSNDCIIGITSWTNPYTELSYQAASHTFGPGPFNKTADYPAVYDSLVSEELQVPAQDGVMIPLSLIYKKGLKKDGTAICLMKSYGAYGTSMMPRFDYMLNSLAVKGVLIAIPHVRGGSEKGEAWYKAGFKTTKPNTWKDFNSCAAYLIRKGYTSADRLAGTGTSAGGILISRAITEQPELYAAAICNVGCANAMRMENTPNGPANIPEFGTVKDSVECRALYEMDGVQHVRANTRYPAVICVAGWNDPRIIAWQPGKFGAALQQASVSGKPVLIKVNYNNGHFTEDKSVAFANFADQFAFVLWQCGHPQFRLKHGK